MYAKIERHNPNSLSVTIVINENKDSFGQRLGDKTPLMRFFSDSEGPHEQTNVVVGDKFYPQDCIECFHTRQAKMVFNNE